MKATVVREMTTQEIAEQLVEEKLNYAKMKMAHTISPLENPIQLRNKRKDIARLASELRSRQINGEQK